MLIGSVFSVVFAALGVWASVMAINGGFAGFVALVLGRRPEKIIEEFQLGAVAGFPTGFLFFIAAVITLD